MSSAAEIPKMEYVRFGTTGMKVSKIALGCASFGSSEWSPWVKDEEESIKIIKQAYEAGVNYFDTADSYSNCQSEIVLGKALKQIGASRGRVVIATKVNSPVYENVGDRGSAKDKPEMVNCYGSSRKHIFDAVDASLKRLDIDYIDLYQLNTLDKETPMEEIMEALHDVIKSGKVRYIDASNLCAWKGWTKFASQQNLYNLIYREEEREMIPYCLDAGIAGIPYSPLAMGELTGKNRKTARADAGAFLSNLFPGTQQSSNDIIIDRVEEIAKNRSVSNAQIAIAWLYTKKYFTSLIVGCSKIEQLHDIMGSFCIKLSEDEVKYLEESYTPKPVSGH